MIDHYLRAYFTNEQYLRIDGKPVLFVMNPTALAEKTAAFGETQASLYDKANKMVIASGLPGITRLPTSFFTSQAFIYLGYREII